MKKIYLLLSAAVITTAGFAQYRVGNGPTSVSIKNVSLDVKKMQNNKAAGDSLLYFDSEGFYVVDAQDQTDFTLANQDFDGATPAQTGWPTDFIFSFINTDAAETPYTTPGGDFFPHDITAGTDTAWFIGASSWFTPAAQANNWWNFGPITIPAATTGNFFYWHDKSNPAWTDSYDVYIVNMTNVADPANPDGLVDVTGNGLTPDFTRTQIPGTGGQPAQDTSWTLQSINLDAFAGQRIFVFFNHDANDGDALFLDEMWVKEGTATGIEELNTVNFNVYPNPSKGEFNINLTANNTNNVSLIVRDVLGKVVLENNIMVSGQKTETISLANYDKGIYFLTIDNQTVKLIVE